MNPRAELDTLDLDPCAKSQGVAMCQTRLAQVERDAKTIQAKDLKIEALTHELAQLRRIRFGVKSETLAPLQRDVFGKPGTPTCPPLQHEYLHKFFSRHSGIPSGA